MGPHPRPHPQPRRPAVRPVHDQAADAVLDVRAGGAALRPHRLPGGRAPGGAGRARTPARAVRHRASTGCSASRSPATGSATTTGSAASCCSPTCTSTTSLRWTDNRLSLDWERLPQVVHRPGRRGRGALPRRHRPLPSVAHWLASYELVSRYVATAPGSTWAKGTVALPLDGPPQAPDRRGAAGRVPAQHVLRGAAQEARRRHRLHLRDHAHEHGGRRWPARSPAGWSSWPGRPVPRGRRWCARLAAAGATVVAADASAERLEPVVARARSPRGRRQRAPADVVDLLDEQATRDWAAEVLAEFGRVDGLVHLVGGWRGGKSFTETDLADWALLQDLLIRTLQHTSLAFHDSLRASDDAAGSCWSRRSRRRRRRPATPPTPRPRPPPRPGPWRWQTRSAGGEQRPAAARSCRSRRCVTTAMRAGQAGGEVQRLHRRLRPGRRHRSTCG